MFSQYHCKHLLKGRNVIKLIRIRVEFNFTVEQLRGSGKGRPLISWEEFVGDVT